MHLLLGTVDDDVLLPKRLEAGSGIIGSGKGKTDDLIVIGMCTYLRTLSRFLVRAISRLFGESMILARLFWSYGAVKKLCLATVLQPAPGFAGRKYRCIASNHRNSILKGQVWLY